MNAVQIRPARPADAADVARVQVATWQSTYLGQVPDSSLAFFTDLERRERQWLEALTQAESDPHNLRRTFVAEAAQEGLIGFAIAGPTRFAEGDPAEALLYQGEVYAIYVLAEQQKRGLGAQLMTASARYLQDCGLHGLLVWALETNIRARGFYERLGGQPVAYRKLNLAGALVNEVGYGWARFEG
jgi:ribosomal protein S18 acetylase RimI-like enzyme